MSRSLLESGPATCWRLWFVVLLVAVTLAPSASYSAEIFDKVGTVGAAFLTIEPDPRGEALGGAYSALADGPSGVYWNPAGLGFSSGVEFADQRHIAPAIEWPAGLDVSFAAMSVSLGTLAKGLPVGTLCLWQGRMEAEPLPETAEYRQEGTGYQFDYWEKALGVSYAHRVTPCLSLGASYKRIESKFADSKAKGTGFDIGAAFRRMMVSGELSEVGVGAAAGIRNLGSLGPYGSSGASWDLPRQAYVSVAPTVRIGRLWDWVAETTVTGEAAYDDPRDRWVTMAGIELTVASCLSYRYGTYHADGSDRRNSSGAGFALRYRDMVGLAGDYSRTEFKTLG
ncbi:MAG: hypothetical protein WAW06_02950, partial [bacterium]